ncbi:MAG: hypothetical protein CMJ23_12660 [Phycisphaerae bacterium]|nr:hypothetical protein [Phycisphaerae bacterium]
MHLMLGSIRRMTHSLKQGAGDSAGKRRGFSMVELIVVLSVVTVLTALLMPGIRSARRTAYSVICSANQRQIGIGFMLWSEDRGGLLPKSLLQTEGDFAEMMAVTTGGGSEEMDKSFDGLGRLWEWRYIDSPRCLHCPAHRHTHTYECNEETYEESLTGDVEKRVYANYHYTGHLRLEPLVNEGRQSLRSMHRAGRSVLLTDGLRSREDFNHETGLNVLYADGSSQWQADTGSKIISSLPSDANSGTELFTGDNLGIQMIWFDLGVDSD